MGAKPTATAMYQLQPGQSLVAAFPNVTPNGISQPGQDLIHIGTANGKATIVVVTAAGVVLQGANLASSQGGGTRIGRFLTRLSFGATLTAIFADTFANPSNLDILQVMNIGGNVSYWLDAAGVAHGS